MLKIRENKMPSLRGSVLGCLLLLVAPCVLAAENKPGQLAPTQPPSEQPKPQKPPASRSAASPPSPPAASPPSAFSPFVPSEKISAGKAVSFPKDI